MNKLNRYLLTHHPLVWNTRLLTVLAVNLFIHLFFFLIGYGSVNARELFEYSDMYEVGGGNLFGLSILCSLLVLIVWLIFYLRNNAFKSHYRIDRWHLAREFFILLLIVGSSFSYFLSFGGGVKLHTKNITSAAAYQRETDIVNKAMAFVPLQLAPYHVDQSCSAQRKREAQTNNNYIDGTTDGPYRFQQFPDSNFSYRNYCGLAIYPYGRYGFENRGERERISQTVQSWLAKGAKDSVLGVLQELETLCRKYGIEYSWNAERVSSWVFADPGNLLTHVINNVKPDSYITNPQATDPDYIEEGKLLDALRFVRRTYDRDEDYWGVRLGLAYTILSVSILLLCYRRFSRKAFLISIVGSLLLTIIIGLLIAASGGREEAFAGLCIFLCIIFLLVGLACVRTRSGKTMAGTTLSWHAWLVPYLVMFIWMFVNEAYDFYFRYGSTMTEERMRAEHPLLYWIHHHTLEIFTANLLLSIAYIALVFNRIAKRWMEMPEE